MAFPEKGAPYEIGWDPPAALSDRLRAVVTAELAEIGAQSQPADRPQVAKWLASLASLVAGGRITAEDAKLKLNAYTAMFAGAIPASILTRKSLDAVARQFTFLPSYAELALAIDDLQADTRRRERKLRCLAALPAPEPERAPPTEAERQAVAAMLADFRATPVLKAAPDKPSPRPEAEVISRVAEQSSAFRLPDADDPKVRAILERMGEA